MQVVLAIVEVALAWDMPQVGKAALVKSADTVVVSSSLGSHLPQT